VDQLFSSIRNTANLFSSCNTILPKIDKQLKTMFLKVKVIGALKGKLENKIKIRNECIEIYEQSNHSPYLNRVISLLYRHRANEVNDDYEKAVANYERAMELDHTIPKTKFHYFKADFLYDIGRYEESILELSKCIELEPANDFYLIERGMVYKMLDKYIESIEDMNRALLLSPNNIEALGYRLSAFEGLDRIEEALDDANKIIELNPGKSEIYLWKARCCVEMDRYSDAIQCCDKATLVEGTADTYNTIAYIYRSMKMFDEAFTSVEKALELEPADANLVLTKAELLYEIGKYEEGIQYCTKAIELDSNLQAAFRYRSLCYMAKNQIQQALVDAQSTVII
jgi:tetratricopeptide (TPR) repeat protein